MFFPYRVGESLNKKVDIDGKGIFTVAFFAELVAGVFVYSYINTFLSQFISFHSIISFLIVLVLIVVVSITVIRIFIIDESSKLKEESNSKDDKLERFYQIRETELPTIIDDIEVFENLDGNLVACVEILYGPNDKYKAEKSLSILTYIMGRLGSFCLDFKTYTIREEFDKSIECKRFLSTINRSKNKGTSPHTSAIADKVLRITREKGKLESTFIVMRFTPLNSQGLKGLKNDLIETTLSSNSSIRSINFVDRARYREFIREYFCVDALDLGGFRNQGLTKKLMKKYRKEIYYVENANVDIKVFNTEVSKL